MLCQILPLLTASGAAHHCGYGIVRFSFESARNDGFKMLGALFDQIYGVDIPDTNLRDAREVYESLKLA